MPHIRSITILADGGISSVRVSIISHPFTFIAYSLSFRSLSHRSTYGGRRPGCGSNHSQWVRSSYYGIRGRRVYAQCEGFSGRKGTSRPSISLQHDDTRTPYYSLPQRKTTERSLAEDISPTDGAEAAGSASNARASRAAKVCSAPHESTLYLHAEHHSLFSPAA